jgi:hypothetical protein
MNKGYTVSQVRERLAEALDAADRGLPVFIVRRGARYQLSLAPDTARRSTAKRPPRIDVLDAAVEAGQWGWRWTASGLTFRGRRSR